MLLIRAGACNLNQLMAFQDAGLFPTAHTDHTADLPAHAVGFSAAFSGQALNPRVFLTFFVLSHQPDTCDFLDYVETHAYPVHRLGDRLPQLFA